MKYLWSDQAVDGKRKDKWDGSGKEKGCERKNTRERQEELEAYKSANNFINKILKAYKSADIYF